MTIFYDSEEWEISIFAIDIKSVHNNKMLNNQVVTVYLIKK